MEVDNDEIPNVDAVGATAAAANTNTTSSSSLSVSSEHELEEQRRQQERRNSIKSIMSDDSLTPLEKRRTIQALMDGRTSRRNSMASQVSRRNSMASQVSNRRGSMASTASFSSVDEPSFSSPGDGADVDGRPSDVVMMHIPASHPMEGAQVGGTDTTVDYHGYYGYEGAETEASMNADPDTTNEQHQSSTDVQASTGIRKLKPRSSSMPLWSDATSRVTVTSPMAAGGMAGPANSSGSYSVWDDPIMVNQRMEKSRPPCPHYERNCTIISPCCGMAFGCRICHDECPVLPMPFAKHPLPPHPLPPSEEDIEGKSGVYGEYPMGKTGSTIRSTTTSDSSMGAIAEGSVVEPMMAHTQPRDSFLNWDQAAGVKQRLEKRRSLPLSYLEDDVETHHEIDRFAIAEVICRLCYTRQSSKSNFCSTCHTQFGAYHCSRCNLWMSDEEEPYHCQDCGFCRVGGRDNFKHCHDCGMCIDVNLFDDHNCKAGKYMSNCPVCQEDLFSSRDASHEMPCGHAIHWHCFKELTSYDTRCPVCKKTAETPEAMASTWHAMAVGISLQPVPPELARVVTITCNDCEETEEDRRWHFLGVRCNACGSFNTNVDRTSLTGREASLYLDELDLLRGVNPPAQNSDNMDQS